MIGDDANCPICSKAMHWVIIHGDKSDYFWCPYDLALYSRAISFKLIAKGPVKENKPK